VEEAKLGLWVTIAHIGSTGKGLINVCRGTEKGVENTQRLSSGNNSGRLEKEREQW
jgi:hypothetical protein